MIQVKNIVKQYGNKTVLDQVCFEIKEGEILGLLGRNGAGKSTIMNIMTGNLGATEGTVVIDGHDILEDSLAARKNLGYLPELPPLYEEMTVKSYLRFVYGLKKCKLPRETHIREVCERTRIENVYGRVIRNLSKGYRQRIGIAQAILGNPKVIILDEPMVGLDPRQIVELRDLILSLRDKHTILLSSHILTEVQSICDRIVVLSEGHVVADDMPEHLMSHLAGHQLRLRVEGKEERIEAVLKAIPGIASIERQGMREKGSYDFLVKTVQGADVRREIFRRLADRHCPLLYMTPMETTLENVFLQLTGTEQGGMQNVCDI